MVSVDLQPLFALLGGLSPASIVAAILAFFYFCLKAIVAMVATFASGELRKNAYRVLKILTRRKPAPPELGAP